MSNEAQVKKLTDIMAQFVGFTAMMSLQNCRN